MLTLRADCSLFALKSDHSPRLLPVGLGYNRLSSSQDLRWVVSRIFLHTGTWQAESITETACDELAEACRAFGERADIAYFHGSAQEYQRRSRKSYLTAIHRLKVVLYHRGQAATEPWKIMPKYAAPSPGHPRMLVTIARYLTARSLTSRPGTITRLEVSFRRFMQWLSQAYPHIETFAEVTRDHLFEFAQWLSSRKGMHSGQPLSTLTKRGNLSALSVFFRDTASWEWEDVPGRPPAECWGSPQIARASPTLRSRRGAGTAHDGHSRPALSLSADSAPHCALEWSTT
jgi:hypothetical protein